MDGPTGDSLAPASLGFSGYLGTARGAPGTGSQRDQWSDSITMVGGKVSWLVVKKKEKKTGDARLREWKGGVRGVETVV